MILSTVRYVNSSLNLSASTLRKVQCRYATILARGIGEILNVCAKIISWNPTKLNSMKEVFIELQKASGLDNFSCGEYLGISEGAVKDRRRGTFEARRSELIALAIFGSSSESRAIELIQNCCDHKFIECIEDDQAVFVCRKCKLSKYEK